MKVTGNILVWNTPKGLEIALRFISRRVYEQRVSCVLLCLDCNPRSYRCFENIHAFEQYGIRGLCIMLPCLASFAKEVLFLFDLIF